MQRALPVPVVCVFLLAGCGVAGTEFHPGVAAEVGDETITTRHVDQLTDGSCRALEEFNESTGGSGSTPTPLQVLGRQVTTALVDRAAAAQLAEQYDVTTTVDYKTNLTSVEAQLADVDGDRKEALLEVVEAQAYAQDVLLQIGAIELEKQGQTETLEDERYAEGQKVLAAWADENDVTINPKYGIGPGSEAADTNLSFAVGQTAKDGLADPPGASYTDSLPGDLVCFD